VPERILTGTALADTAEMARFVADCRTRWSTDDDRVAGTLWWYTTSTILLTPLLTRLVEIDLAPDPALDRLRLHVGEDGRMLNVRPSGLLPDTELLPGALRATLETVVTTLSAVSGVRVRPLWAITTDSIANVLLRAWRDLGAAERSVAQARWLVSAMGEPLPASRFIDIDGVPLVRRVSCCLIYQAGFAKCASCPHQEPAERLARMTQAAKMV
jgi:ferric iron reductase protein FhuF